MKAEPNPICASNRPDPSWIKKNVPVLQVGQALGMDIRNRRAQCWRSENHRHGDADPSLHFYEKGNRVRCFVCDMKGGHSCIDLVMAVLNVEFSAAVRWIADRFTVPNVKAGRPIGSHAAPVAPYRVGIQDPDFENVMLSGMWGQLSAPARSLLAVLHYAPRDPDSGLTQISYIAMMRYAGVGSRVTVSRALKLLARLGAIEIHRGSRIGITRECSAYRVTLDNPKFLGLCNEVYRTAREPIAQERAYRKRLRLDRERRSSQSREQGKAPTCEGLNLCSPSVLRSHKSVHSLDRKISLSSLREFSGVVN